MIEKPTQESLSCPVKRESRGNSNHPLQRVAILRQYCWLLHKTQSSQLLELHCQLTVSRSSKQVRTFQSLYNSQTRLFLFSAHKLVGSQRDTRGLLFIMHSRFLRPRRRRALIRDSRLKPLRRRIADWLRTSAAYASTIERITEQERIVIIVRGIRHVSTFLASTLTEQIVGEFVLGRITVLVGRKERVSTTILVRLAVFIDAMHVRFGFRSSQSDALQIGGQQCFSASAFVSAFIGP